MPPLEPGDEFYLLNDQNVKVYRLRDDVMKRMTDTNGYLISHAELVERFDELWEPMPRQFSEPSPHTPEDPQKES